MLLIIKNLSVDASISLNEYLIINTENNQLHRKNMTVDQAKSFSEKLEAEPTAPIELLGKNYTEVSKEEFEYPLPF